MTNATKRTLARLGSVLSRAPISTPVGLVVAAGCLAAETAVTLWLKITGRLARLQFVTGADMGDPA